MRCTPQCCNEALWWGLGDASRVREREAAAREDAARLQEAALQNAQEEEEEEEEEDDEEEWEAIPQELLLPQPAADAEVGGGGWGGAEEAGAAHFNAPSALLSYAEAEMIQERLRQAEIVEGIVEGVDCDLQGVSTWHPGSMCMAGWLPLPSATCLAVDSQVFCVGGENSGGGGCFWRYSVER